MKNQNMIYKENFDENIKEYLNPKKLRRVIMLATISGSPRVISKWELLLFILYAILPLIIIFLFPHILNYYLENIETNEIYKEDPSMIIGFSYIIYFIILFFILSYLQKKARLKVKNIIKYEKENNTKIIPDDLRKFLPEKMLKESG